MSLTGALKSIYGIEIITSPFMPTQREVGRTQVRFPRSKKKRIRKKWAKDVHNFKVHYEDCTGDAIQVGPDKYMMHPAGYERLKELLARRAAEKVSGLLGWRIADV